MNIMKKRILLFIFFTLIIVNTISVNAQSNNQIEVLLSGPKEVYINDKLEIELSIKTQGDITIEPSIILIGINAFEEIGNTIKIQTETINGNVMQVQYLKKILKPTKTGIFTIGPSILKTSMGEIKSNTITVDVFDRTRSVQINIDNEIDNIKNNLNKNIAKISIIMLSFILILSLYFLIRLEYKGNKNVQKENNINKNQIKNKKEIIINTDKKIDTQDKNNNIEKNTYNYDIDIEIEKLCKKIIENHNIKINPNEIKNFNTLIKKLIEINTDQDLIEQYKKEYNNIQKNKWGIKT